MATVEKLSVALTPEMAAMVRAAVEGGDYASTSEVIRDALRLWKAERAARSLPVEELRRAIEIGLAQLDRGESIPGEEVLAEVTRRLEARRR